MSGYEQSKTEASGMKVSGPKRKTIAQESFSRIESEIMNEQKIKEKIERIGNGKYIDEGIIARLLGIDTIDINKLSNADLTSYNFGYYTTSNALMILLSIGIIPERLTKIIIRKRLTITSELIPSELLKEIGKRDSNDNNIDISAMSKELQTNESYLKGYTSGKSR